jgi:AcrR family transcriptional regulator
MVRAGPAADADRIRVLDGALDAFLDYGIRRTSMGEIAKRSGVSPATLYRRFAQKADVVQGVGLREVHRLLADVDRRVDRTLGADDQVVELYVAFLGGLRRNQLLARLLVTEPETVLPLLTVQGAPVLELGRAYLVEVIERLQDNGAVARYDPAPVAEVLARVALSMALTPETTIPVGEDDEARQFARCHITAVLHGR